MYGCGTEYNQSSGQFDNSLYGHNSLLLDRVSFMGVLAFNDVSVKFKTLEECVRSEYYYEIIVDPNKGNQIVIVFTDGDSFYDELILPIDILGRKVHVSKCAYDNESRPYYSFSYVGVTYTMGKCPKAHKQSQLPMIHSLLKLDNGELLS